MSDLEMNVEEESGTNSGHANGNGYDANGGSLHGADDAFSSASSSAGSSQVAPDALDDIPEIELIIRASTIDGHRKGACIFCQEYFMDLYLLAELKTISLKVTTVHMLKPPSDFRSKFDSTPPPILVDRGEPVLENEKIERYIMKNIPGGHNLFVSDKEASNVIEDIYTKFKLMLAKKDTASRTAFLNRLQKIEMHLTKRKSRYLTGDTLCCFDCELMTRLQHIRVAGKYFLDFEIPEEHIHLWRYMYHMYNLDAFKQSCPADQDIINHYKLQQRTKLSKHEELEAPTYTSSIPESVFAAYEHEQNDDVDHEDHETE